MKRAISIVCAAFLLVSILCLVGCSENIDGSYTMVEYTLDGEDATGELGDTIVTLDVNGDTATLSGMKELTGVDDQEYTVDTEKKTMTDEAGYPFPYTVDGNKLTLENSGYKIVFEK